MSLEVREFAGPPILTADEANLIAAVLSPATHGTSQPIGLRGSLRIEYSSYERPRRSDLLLELQSSHGLFVNQYATIFGGAADSHELVKQSIAQRVSQGETQSRDNHAGGFFGYDSQPVLLFSGQQVQFMLSCCFECDPLVYAERSRTMLLAAAAALTEIFAGDSMLRRSYDGIQAWLREMRNHEARFIMERTIQYLRGYSTEIQFLPCFQNWTAWKVSTYPEGKRPAMVPPPQL